MDQTQNSADQHLTGQAEPSGDMQGSLEELEIQIRETEKFLRDSGETSLHIIDILQRSRQDFFAIFDSVPAIIWYRDAGGTILRANQCAADSVGLGVRELIGRNYYDLVVSDVDRSRRQDLEVISSGRPLQGIMRTCEMGDGTVCWMTEDRFPLRDKAGNVIGVMVFAQDVTERKLAEERLLCAKRQIEVHNEQLKAAAEKSHKRAEDASRSNLAKSRILASSSHDLRTPMNAIIGFAELLLETTLSDEQAEYVQTIYKSSTSLLSLINDILDFTKLEVGKLNVRIADCEVAELIEDIRSMMEPGIRQKGLTFNARIDPELPKTFFTDAFRLRQCLINLIGNAMKFTDCGGVSLCVRSDCRAGRCCIRFDVADSGIGIPEDKQRQIFQSFEQAEDVIERIYGGTGLGLTISRRLVSLLGGHISVISEPGKGSIFSILLPLLNPNDPHPTDLIDILQDSEDPTPDRCCRARILAVDANRPGQLTMNLLLRRQGLTVRIASSLDEFYDKLTDSEFDMVVLDIADDVGQGLEMVRRIRACSDLPIIAIAACDPELMKQALSAGCSKYLTRPVSRKHLYESINELMRQRELEQKLQSIISYQNSGQTADEDENPSGKVPPNTLPEDSDQGHS